jgi:hypothetical protein
VVYEERNTWAGLIASVVGLTVYVILIVQQLASRPVAEIDWVPVMLWTIGGAIVGSILLSIVWGSPRACATERASDAPTSAIATSRAWAAASDRRSW